MYTETANLMQASTIGGGLTEIQNENFSLVSQEIMYICNVSFLILCFFAS